jgi:hypothetical protein
MNGLAFSRAMDAFFDQRGFRSQLLQRSTDSQQVSGR